ncbi:hypothetical protein ABIC08_009187 [Bradyrhizobium sp. RT9b]|uniref:hypothetical protein n=1 Tax=Bradyrhizobium sp. RT9b TaxID=3156385 RepID=UPI003397308A
MPVPPDWAQHGRCGQLSAGLEHAHDESVGHRKYRDAKNIDAQRAQLRQLSERLTTNYEGLSEHVTSGGFMLRNVF